MKSKFFKIILPAFAILLAISLSFATESNRVSQIGYYDDPFIPGIQQVPGGTECPTNGDEYCMYDGHQVYGNQALTLELFEKE
tara:strand:+ start:543 stop:791 length:249 start_codon:yes stop_codon:yes gene_type:complete